MLDLTGEMIGRWDRQRVCTLLTPSKDHLAHQVRMRRFSVIKNDAKSAAKGRFVAKRTGTPRSELGKDVLGTAYSPCFSFPSTRIHRICSLASFIRLSGFLLSRSSQSNIFFSSHKHTTTFLGGGEVRS